MSEQRNKGTGKVAIATIRQKTGSLMVMRTLC